MNSFHENLISPPILELPYAGGHYTLDTNAHDLQVGCARLQNQLDKTNKSVGYWSRCLIKAEKSYGTMQREFLVIVWSALLLRLYLKEWGFIIRADHDSFQWILNLAYASRRLFKWRLRLLEIEFDDVHRASVIHQVADVLSRLLTDGTDTTPLKHDLPVTVINVVNHDNHGCPSDMLKDSSSSLTHLNSEQKKLKTPFW